jgi:hypothetical protein
MSPDTPREIHQAIAAELRAHGEVRPPWEYNPDIDPYSIGWRMGDGEFHREIFSNWWDRTGWNEDQKLEYFRRHRPPTAWLSFAASAVWGSAELLAGDDRWRRIEEGVQRLEAHGIGSVLEWRRWHRALLKKARRHGFR